MKNERKVFMGPLLQKEWKMFLQSRHLAWRTYIGPVLSVLIAGWMCYLGPDHLERMLAAGDVGVYVSCLLPVLLPMFFVWSIPASCSITLEGPYLWTLRQTPLKAIELIQVKFWFNISLLFPFLVADMILLSRAFALTFYGSLVMMLAPLNIVIALVLTGLYLNLRLPPLEYEEGKQPPVVKSRAARSIVTVGLTVLIALMLIILLLSITAGYDLALGGSFLVLGMGLLLYRYMYYRSEWLFSQM